MSHALVWTYGRLHLPAVVKIVHAHLSCLQTGLSIFKCMPYSNGNYQFGACARLSSSTARRLPFRGRDSVRSTSRDDSCNSCELFVGSAAFRTSRCDFSDFLACSPSLLADVCLCIARSFHQVAPRLDADALYEKRRRHSCGIFRYQDLRNDVN